MSVDLERVGRRISQAVAALRQRLPERKITRKRVLVNEILSLQILTVALAGLLAVAGLYWGGQWVLQDNYGRWALQWTEELNELGAPLYIADDGESRLRLESFVERYPEIDRVSYFASDGTALFSVDNRDERREVSNLDAGRLAEAIALIGNRKPYVMTGGLLDPQQFQVLAPVWTESIADDGLFGFDPAADGSEAQVELLGFVGLELDFVMFHDRLLSNIRIAIFVVLLLLVAFALYGRRSLQKALASISDLQQPIRELARGNLDVKFEPAAHREISDIVEALETTASALSERDAALRRLANQDSLTGLLNRRRFVEELRKEIIGVMRDGHTSALFFIDLDQFKYINDACGHPAGDRLIQKVADELRRSVRHDDRIARFGGDEFAILIRKTDVNGAQASASKILGNMRRLAHIEEDRVFHVHCSIGVTLLSGDNLHHDDLINQADIACREAKSAGRNRMCVFEASEISDVGKKSDVGWMNSLRKAVDDDEFELRFQPINRIDTGETTHHEVLIRFRMADGQLVSPDAFLPSAVRFGLMSEIDFWMIRHAAKAYAEHSRPGQGLQLAINLSANAFENEELVNFVEKMFKRHEVDPGNIILEMTESIAIRRPVHVDRQIAALRDLGCRFALDDFGTGYSSFSYLQKLQFDYLKIDGTFVQDLASNPVDQKMVRLIAEIGKEAGMQTIAEYVQDAESLALLGDLGVDMAQGYFVGRPSRTPQLRTTPISLASRRVRQSPA